MSFSMLGFESFRSPFLARDRDADDTPDRAASLFKPPAFFSSAAISAGGNGTAPRFRPLGCAVTSVCSSDQPAGATLPMWTWTSAG